MTERNEDGLVPGQPVDWETMTRVNLKRKDKPADEPVKRGRPAKARDNGQ